MDVILGRKMEVSQGKYLRVGAKLLLLLPLFLSVDQFLSYTTDFHFQISRYDLPILCFDMSVHVSHLLNWLESHLNINSCTLGVERYQAYSGDNKLLLYLPKA